MSIDLKLLAWSSALTFVQMLIAVLGAILQVGLPTLAGNREKLPVCLYRTPRETETCAKIIKFANIKPE